MNIHLPVSLGEAMDKLSILQIKCDKIIDIRRCDVENEYNTLLKILSKYVCMYDGLYQSMLHINRIIWEQMNILRDGNTDDVLYTKLCRECILMNDVRFRIKNKINLISASNLKEQKSYKINRINIQIEVESDIHLFIEHIRQLSFLYDEINIISSCDITSIRDTFYYDNTILYNTEHTIGKLIAFYDTLDIANRLGLDFFII